MSLPRYPEYKDSGVAWLGEVPAHWNLAPLKRGFEVCLGKMLQTESATVGDLLLPYLRAANIQWSGVDTSDIKSMWFSERDRQQLKLVEGDLLVSEGGDVGRSAIWQNEVEECYIQNSVNRVRGKLGNHSRFLYYWMATIKSKGYVDVLCNKSTIAHFTAEKVAEVPVPFPPPLEQTAISTFLDRETAKIDALISEQEKLLTLLAEKRQATISHAVTKGLNPDAPMKDSELAWIREVPVHWEIRRLKGISPQITVGIVVEPSKYYCDEGVPALRSLNVEPGRISAENLVFISAEANEQLQKSRLAAGDLVAVRSGQVGTTAVVPQELNGCNCIDLIIIRKPLEDCEQFLCWFLGSDPAKQQFSEGSGGAIQQHFNIGMAMNLVIPRPPASEQRLIANFLNAETARLDALTAEATRAIDLLKERRAALISAAVTGKIDVRHLAN